MRELSGNDLISVSGGAQNWKIDQIDVTGSCQRDQYRFSYDADPGSSWKIDDTSSNSTSSWVSQAAAGVATAVSDCANGGQAGAILGAGMGLGAAGVGAALGGAIGGAAGCVIGAGVGLLRDLGK